MEGKKIKLASALGTLLVLAYSFIGVFALIAILAVTAVLFSPTVELILFVVLVALFVAIPFIFAKARRKAFDKKLEEENFTVTAKHLDKGRSVFAMDETHNRVAFMAYMNPFNIYILDAKDLENVGGGMFGKSAQSGIGFWFTAYGSKKLLFRTFFKNTDGSTTGYLVGGVIGAAIGSAIERAHGGDAKYQIYVDEAAEWAEKIVAMGGTKEVPTEK